MAALDGPLLREVLGSLEVDRAATDGRKDVVSDVRWQRCRVESSYDTYTVTASFRDRPDLRVFLKDFGTFHQTKDDMEQRRERERHVYSGLLAAASLDTARYYGSVWEPARGRFWLLLELVEGTPLKFMDFEYWPGAAAWLGRLQGYIAQHPGSLNATDCLIQHDAPFFLATAEHALQSVRALRPEAATDFESILIRYEPLVRRMAGQPKTLVHGAYRPEQILVDVQRQPSRFCPLDWELAAIGSGVYDLATLADGFKPPRLDRILDAYRDEAATLGVHVPEPDELKYLVNCFRLHRVFTWLSHALDRSYTEKDVTKLTEMAKELAASLSEVPAGKREYTRCGLRAEHVAMNGTTKTWQFPTIEVDNDHLRGTVEEVLSARLRRVVSVRALKRDVSPFASLYPADILSITLADGLQLSLFLKHLGHEEMDHPDKLFGREVRIYDELLKDRPLPVPKYYGTVWNSGSKRHELFLEYISGWNLKYQKLDHWYTAARSLAQLHAFFAAHAEILRGCDFLLPLDTAYLTRWAEKAFETVAARSAELAVRLEPVLANYDRVVGLITSQPATLVHNDLAPKNVLADPTADPARIFIIDWEVAGASCGLLDLVHLKYGLDPDSDRKLCAAYFGEIDGTGVVPASASERVVVLAACDLQKTMYRLAHHQYWGLPLEKMAAFVEEAETHFRSVT
jgi:thiamine kinase-like enzyme